MIGIRALLSLNMKKGRGKLGITQAELAERVGSSANYIAQIEQQNKFPSPEMLERIALALEYENSELFSQGPFPVDAIKRFRKGVRAEINAVNIAINEKLDELINQKEH